MKFDLTTPCNDCPFRIDGKGVQLGPGRWQEIRECIEEEDGYFPCHKTIDYGDHDDTGSPRLQPGMQHCAGAMIHLEQLEKPNQFMRVAERLGLYDPDQLDDVPMQAGATPLPSAGHGSE